MHQVTIPVLRCPFQPRINPAAAAAEHHLTEWVQHHKLSGVIPLGRFQANKLGHFAARCYPDASFSNLCLGVDLNAWMFLIDDYLDELPEPEKAPCIHALQHAFKAIMQGDYTGDPGKYLPFVASFAELWNRLQARKPSDEWVSRLIKSIWETAGAADWEAKNSLHNSYPAMSEYIRMRPFLGAMYPIIEMIEVVEDIRISPFTLQHPYLQQLRNICASVVCWANDLFSFCKEQEIGHTHNLVSIIMNERRLDMKAAAREVASLYTCEIQLFQDIAAGLRQQPVGQEENVQRYQAALQACIRANLDWSLYDTKRFRLSYTGANDQEWFFEKRAV